MKKLYIFLLSFACMQSLKAASSEKLKAVPSQEALSRLEQAGLLRDVPLHMRQKVASQVGSEFLFLPRFHQEVSRDKYDTSAQELDASGWTRSLTLLKKFKTFLGYSASKAMVSAVHQDSGEMYEGFCRGYECFGAVVAQQSDKGTIRPLAQAKLLYAVREENGDDPEIEALLAPPVSRKKQQSPRFPNLSSLPSLPFAGLCSDAPRSSGLPAQPGKKRTSLAAQIARL